MRHHCYFCHIKTIEKLIDKFKPEAHLTESFIFAVHEYIAKNRKMENPELAAGIQRIARQHLQNTDLYAEEKRNANTMLLGKYAHWQKVVTDSDNPFATAAKLSVIGNIIDYGAHSVHENLSDQIDAFFQKEIAVNHLEALREEIGKAESVLYLGDNCGEIVFDKLFIETMNHPNVTFAVRGKPVLNDATLDDAVQVGMDKVCRIISNGADAPSTLLHLCPDDFVSAFNEANLIISKGQGNFEGLMESDHPNIFFLLIAKCDPIAELLEVKKHDMVITKKP